MLANRLKQAGRLINAVNFAFSRTFAIVSGGPEHDYKTQKIMEGLKKAYDGDVNFIGVGPEKYDKLFEKRYVDSDQLDATPVQINRGYIEVVQDTPITLYRMKTHFKNRQVINSLTKQGYFEDIIEKKVSAVINVGNFSLMKRLNKAMIESYKLNLLYSPPTFFYDPLHRHRRVENEAFLDFQFSSLPRKPSSWSHYVFPHLLIGYEGLFNALHYLNKFGPLPTGEEGFADHMFKLTTAARKKYRADHSISEDAFVVLVAPGNTVEQVEFTMDQVVPSIKSFLSNKEIQSYGLENFKVLVLETKDKLVASVLNNSAPSNMTIIGHEDKYAAMAAADYGLIHDGELAVEAAVCQLAATTLNKMSFMHAYISNMLNLYESPLNVSTDSLGYTELKSSSEAIPYKINTLLLEHFKRPKLKFFYIERYEKTLAEIISATVKDGQIAHSGLAASYDVIKSYVGKYEATDLKSYSGHWQARKDIIVPESKET